MPELKQCPKCQIKAGKYIYNPMWDEMRPIKPLVYGVKFLCLTCDQIYENSDMNKE